MGVLRLIKDLQAELMVSTELPHVVSTRLLARLDEAERHLPMPKATKEEIVVANITEESKVDSDEKS